MCLKLAGIGYWWLCPGWAAPQRREGGTGSLMAQATPGVEEPAHWWLMSLQTVVPPFRKSQKTGILSQGGEPSDV